jgi:cellulose synthase/poly-beta-1,6-N-acetylglucosamine synthase-like glycosyltransferase
VKISVLVPTYHRAEDLHRCLSAIKRQDRRADQVVVVTRDEDAATHAVLQRQAWQTLPLEVVTSPEAGQVAALNTGLRAATGDVIALLDDDTAPWPDWLERIESHFRQNPALGGLGGRDMIRAQGFIEGSETSRVGLISWYGRWVGQAHRGSGPPRQVDLLKGCNMSFRRTAIQGRRFDRRLKGNGAQWFNDAAFTLSVKRGGWQVVYDPAVRVDHYLSERKLGDDRELETPAEVYVRVYNETLILLEHLSRPRRIAFLAWGLAIGTRRAPGLLQLFRAALVGRRADRAYRRAAFRGRRDAWRDVRAIATPQGEEVMSL